MFVYVLVESGGKIVMMQHSQRSDGSEDSNGMSLYATASASKIFLSLARKFFLPSVIYPTTTTTTRHRNVLLCVSCLLSLHKTPFPLIHPQWCYIHTYTFTVCCKCPDCPLNVFFYMKLHFSPFHFSSWILLFI